VEDGEDKWGLNVVIDHDGKGIVQWTKEEWEMREFSYGD